MVTLSPGGCWATGVPGTNQRRPKQQKELKFMKNRSNLAIFVTMLSVLACIGFAYGAVGPESPDPSPFPVNSNTADGYRALENSGNNFNAAFGWFSLFNDTDALFNSGFGAGTDVVDGSHIICIGAGVFGGGPFEDISNTCYIGQIFDEPTSDPGSTHPVCVDQFNVISDCTAVASGKPQAMLNESRNQQKRIAELEGTVSRLAAMVKEQAAQIQKVSAQLEVNNPATKVANNQ